MQTAHGLLLLKLIDCVAAGSDVDGHEGYAELRAKVGEFIIENRVPSSLELDSLSERFQGVVSEFTEPLELSEDPKTHVAPAGLKGDVLRTAGPATTGGRATSAFRDPDAIENLPVDDPRRIAREQSDAAEAGIAYQEGQNVQTPSEITAAAAAAENSGLTGSAVVQGEGADGEGDRTNEDENDEDENETEDENDEDAGDDDDAEPDFKAGTKKDIQAWLKSVDVAYEGDANHATLVKLAETAWKDGKRPAKDEAE